MQTGLSALAKPLNMGAARRRLRSEVAWDQTERATADLQFEPARRGSVAVASSCRVVIPMYIEDDPF